MRIYENYLDCLRSDPETVLIWNIFFPGGQGIWSYSGLAEITGLIPMVKFPILALALVDITILKEVIKLPKEAHRTYLESILNIMPHRIKQNCIGYIHRSIFPLMGSIFNPQFSSIEMGHQFAMDHRNRWFTHEKWWIFPWLCECLPDQIHILVYLRLWKMMEWKSVGGMKFPTEWKQKIPWFQTTNQT